MERKKVSNFYRYFIITVLVILIVVITGFIITFSDSAESDREIEELVVYTWTGDHYFRSMAELFEQNYGIHIRIVVTNGDVYIRKAMSESSQLEGSIDCLLINSSFQQWQLQQGEVLINTKYKGSSLEALQQGTFTSGFIPLYRTVSGFLYDSALFPDPPKTWDQFNRWLVENPEKFGFTAAGGEAGSSFIYSVLNELTGDNFQNNNNFSGSGSNNILDWNIVWQWFRDNRKNLLYSSSDYDSLRLLSSGKLFLTSVMEHHYLNALKEGELLSTVKMYVPDFGSVSEVYGMAVPKNAPNFKGASMFLKFLTSEESKGRMEQMMNVRGDYSSINSLPDGYLSPPDPLYNKSISDSFKDKVLYY